MIRFILALACFALLSACGDAKDDVDLLRSTLNRDAPRFHPRANALASIRPIPPRLEVSFPTRDLAGVMLLETSRAGTETWLTADGATITLKEGLLTSAKGFGSGLAASDVGQSLSLLKSGQTGEVERFHSFLNGNDEIELRAYRCVISSEGREDVFVQGLAVPMVKLKEECFGVDQSFANIYWLRPGTREIVQSSQWTGDFLGNLFMKRIPDE